MATTNTLTPTPSTTAQRYTGKVTGVIFSNPASPFAVFTFQADTGDSFTVAGAVYDPQPNSRLEIMGQWADHPKFGQQFKADGYMPVIPAGIEGIRAFLQSGIIKGVGGSLADAIIAHFGDEVSAILDTAIDRLREVRGVGKAKLAAIKEGWENGAQLRSLMSFLLERGITVGIASKLWRHYGGAALAIIQSNPYRPALEVYGIGFATADQIARALGMAHDDPNRIQAGIVYALEQAVISGHVYLPYHDLLDQSQKLLQVETHLCDKALSTLIEQAKYIVHDGGRYYLPYLHRAETTLANLVKHVKNTRSTLKLDRRRDFRDVLTTKTTSLSDEQRIAVETALTFPFSVVTGGPGTGKSTLTKALCRILAHYEITPLLTAPTGKAAKRLGEVTQLEALTIHRALVFTKDGSFYHDNHNPLETTFIVVDEVSMVDTMLMYHLMNAINTVRPPHIVLVGDVDQLPSVGAGAVLRDLIESQAVPITRLTTIFRQAEGSAIIANAHLIREGQAPVVYPGQQEYLMIERADPLAAQRTVVQAVQRLQQIGFSPSDVIVLSPMRKGEVGVNALNKVLQEAQNPPDVGTPELKVGDMILRQGDRVIQIRNNYDKEVFNGDTGVIEDVFKDDRSVRVRFDDGQLTHYESGDLDELQLAYALSIHKSQGSEYAVAVVVLMNQHYVMLQRNLFYTGITRAKKRVVVIGESRAVQTAVRQQSSRKRYTGLQERLRAQ